MRYFFTLTSSNAKTGNIPQVYALPEHLLLHSLQKGLRA